MNAAHSAAVRQLRYLSAEGVIDRAEIMKTIRANLAAVNGQLTADGLGVTRQAVNKWAQENGADPSLENLCLLARQFGLRLALVPVEECGKP